MDPKEAVARIKERTLVALTIIRGLEPFPHKGQSDDHVYDEIYSDRQLGQNHLDENTPINSDSTMSSGFPLPKTKTGKVPPIDQNQRSHAPKLLQPLSPLPVRAVHRDKPLLCKTSKYPRALEGGSKDSGLSSGSSTHQENEDPHLGRHMFAPSSPVGDSPRHHFHRTGSGSSVGPISQRPTSNSHCHIEGEYEVEVSLNLLALGLSCCCF